MRQRDFAETGIDFAGPFETTRPRKSQKSSICFSPHLYANKSVHFEPTFNQTTESVINALDRFCGKFQTTRLYSKKLRL